MIDFEILKFYYPCSFQGYAAHLASTILEWCLAATFLAYFYTFIRDFQLITLKANTHLHQDTLYHNQHQQLQEELQDGDSVA